ncbi:MAG: alpha/beta hydrolase [Crocinitomicaceae bacterium]
MEYQFTHPKTFRYRTLNEGSSPKTVLYVLHGYGQLVEFFIRKFREIGQDVLVVAPEGMHRFYLKGASGRVGASWMTKEARETDIADNLSYLDGLDKRVSKEYDVEKKYLLGFSQGGATAARWNQLGKSHFDAMILWACVFPPDLANTVEFHRDQKNYFVIGDQDEFYSSEDQEKLVREYSSKNYQIKRYQGRHDIVNKTLTEILDELSNK